MRGHLHLRARPREEKVQGLRRRRLRARPTEDPVERLRWRLHLLARPTEEQVQGLRRRLHLRAQPTEEQVQDMRRARRWHISRITSHGVCNGDVKLAPGMGKLGARNNSILCVVTLPARSTSPAVVGCRLVGCSVVSGRPLRSRAVAGMSHRVCVGLGSVLASRAPSPPAAAAAA